MFQESSPCSLTLNSYDTTTGNLSSLAHLTQLTLVNFQSCRKIEGILNRSHELTTQNMVGQKPVGVASLTQGNIVTFQELLHADTNALFLYDYRQPLELGILDKADFLFWL